MEQQLVSTIHRQSGDRILQLEHGVAVHVHSEERSKTFNKSCASRELARDRAMPTFLAWTCLSLFDPSAIRNELLLPGKGTGNIPLYAVLLIHYSRAGDRSELMAVIERRSESFLGASRCVWRIEQVFGRHGFGRARPRRRMTEGSNRLQPSFPWHFLPRMALEDQEELITRSWKKDVDDLSALSRF
jgi:hypothetical protein